jgi:type I restriction enzyme, S subunit
MKVAQKEGALIDINYFYYFLFPMLQKVWDRTTATTVKHLSTYDISEALEIFPSIPKQRQIATILSTADAVIEKTQATIAKYKAIKQGMLQDLFTRGIDTATGKLRPSYQDAPHLYKESKLGWIPREWNMERLGNRAIIEYGKSQKAVVSINGNIPVYGTGGLMEYATDFLFDGESILIGRKGTIDKPFYINGKFWTVDTAYYLSAFSGNVRWLHSQLEFYNLKRLNEATGVPSINRELLYNIQLSFPDKTEQDEIIKRILSIDQKLQIEQDFLHKHQQIKAGLMSDLLSGNKKVTPNEKEMV